MVFEIWKPACPLCVTSILTVIISSDVWSFVERERWSVQHHNAAVELFMKTELDTATHQGCCQQFQRHNAPCRSTMVLWVLKWYQEGSTKDSKPQGRPLLAHTLSNVEWVRDAMLCTLRGSVRRQTLALLWNKRSIRRILHKDLRYHPYQTHVAQELGENNINIVNTLLMSDEAHFLVSGYVNKQNCHFWAQNNPHEHHQCPLHSARVTVWCAVSSHGSMGPYFFENEEGHTITVNAEWYKVVQRQADFSFWGHHLLRPITWPCSSGLLPLGLC